MHGEGLKEKQMSNHVRPITISVVVPASASTTTYGTATPGLQVYDAVKARITLTGLTGGTLDVSVQESWDSGTTWDECAAFTQVAGSAAAVTYSFAIILDSTIRTIRSGTVSSAAPVLTAGTICSGPWAPLLRLVGKTGGGVSSGATVVLNLFAWNAADAGG